jgi:hypothetical protein
MLRHSTRFEGIYMARRSRAARTKSQLWEITSEKSKEGTNSLEVVTIFKERFPNIDQQEQEDLIDLGLMVLAGRVAVSSRPDNDQADMFAASGYPEFIPIRISSGNRSKLVRKDGRFVTVREYFENQAVPAEENSKAHKPTSRELFHKSMEEMREKELWDMTVPQYLETKKDS